MSDKAYDTWKNIAGCSPLFATFILALKDIWGIPYAVEIAGTLCAFSSLIFGILKVVSNKYFEEHTIIENIDDGRGEE